MKSVEKYDLFNPAPESLSTGDFIIENDIKSIKGLVYLPDFIDEITESFLIKEINNSSWSGDLKRRVQHYGWKYDYKARSIDYSMYLGKLPIWAENIAKKMLLEKIVDEEPDQIIVNEYVSGQGIANHIDCVPCFGDTVISLSLGSSCIMDFINVETKDKIEVFLEPRSLVIIKSDSRYLWTHGIPARQTDFFKGRRYNRNTRLSLTFRKVIVTNKSF